MNAPTNPSGGAPSLELTASRMLLGWLADEKVSLAFTTYQTGKLFLVGLSPDGRMSVFERTFNRCMGLGGDSQTLWMSSLYQLWRLENILEPGQVTPKGYDRLYVPMLGHTTGDIDIHDIVVEEREDGSRRPVFASTLLNCLATTCETHSVTPLWKPPFVSQVAAEDRCHLNGIAANPDNGKPSYVTCVSKSDVADGWRDRRDDGGVVVDVETNQIVSEGLSMPHSPRLHPDYPGKLWLLNSGTGYFGYIDLETGSFEEVAFCGGYGRGMSFCGQYAVVGLSRYRSDRTFTGLLLDENLAAKDAEPRCALNVIDLRTGETVHWLRLSGVVEELYDVVVLHGVTRPMALGFKTEEIRRTLRLGEISGA